jgi:hypothetical protein
MCKMADVSSFDVLFRTSPGMEQTHKNLSQNLSTGGDLSTASPEYEG